MPLKPKGYQVKVAFPEATQLGEQADVRVAGVSVGKLTKKDIDPKQPNRTIATLTIDRKFAPIAKDSKAILRQKTLLGETYVELTPGHARRPARCPTTASWPPHGSPRRSSSTRSSRPSTRRRGARSAPGSRRWRPRSPAAARTSTTPSATCPRSPQDGTDLLTRARQPVAGGLAALVRNTGAVFNAISQNEGQLHNLVTGAGKTFDATASRQEALAQTIKIFPTFLDESKATFARLEKFSKDTDPLIQDLRPVARDLKPTLRDVKALSPDLRNLFVKMDPLITASKTGLPALTDTLKAAGPTLGQLQPFLEQLNPVLQWLEYSQLNVADFISNGAGRAGRHDRHGHVGRARALPAPVRPDRPGHACR